jgi:hypothetical protein
MNRDEQKALAMGLASVGAGAGVMTLLYLWLGWRFVAGLSIGAFGAFGLALLRQRLINLPAIRLLRRSRRLTGLVSVGAGAGVMTLLYLWLGWRFVAGLSIGAFGDTLAYGLVLLQQRLAAFLTIRVRWRPRRPKGN